MKTNLTWFKFSDKCRDHGEKINTKQKVGSDMGEV